MFSFKSCSHLEQITHVAIAWACIVPSAPQSAQTKIQKGVLIYAVSALITPTDMFTDLLHEHVDVSLGCIQDVSVWVFQTFHCDFHRLSIDVDPSWSTACQESPEINESGRNEEEML